MVGADNVCFFWGISEMESRLPVSQLLGVQISYASWASFSCPKRDTCKPTKKTMLKYTNKVTRPSTCVSAMYVTPETGTCTVDFKNGARETYTGVNRGDLEALVESSTTSLGFFLNQVLLGRKPSGQVTAA
jgi:hypothetical protein